MTLIRCLQIVRAGGEWLEREATSLALERLLQDESKKTHLLDD